MLITVSKLTLTSVFQIPRMIKYAGATLDQIRASTGNLHAATTATSLLHHWTFSVWETREDMLSFVRSGAHLEAIQATSDMASVASFLTMEVEETPSFKQARNWLRTSEQTRVIHVSKKSFNTN